MRWVKHMTASHNDEKLADLISRFGHAGYGVWWLVVEIVASVLESGKEPKVTYPVSKWSHLLSVRGSHVSQTLLKLELTHLVTVVRRADDITVTIPNLLKYRDEYNRKSGQTPECVRSKTTTDADIQQTQTTTEEKPRQLPSFPSASEYPETAAAIRAKDPACDDLFVRRLAATVIQAALSDDRIPPAELDKITDAIIADAVKESFATFNGKKGHGTGLLLARVPQIVRNWCKEPG